MKTNLFFKSIIGFTIILLFLVTACTQQKGGVSQFRQTGVGVSLPDEWGNDKNIRWTYDLEGRGWSSPVISGNRVFITIAVNETTKPKDEIDAPPPAPPRPQPVPGQRPGTPRQGTPPGPPRPPAEDTTYKHEVYRWEVICLNLKTGKELWKQVAHKGNPRTGSNPGNGYAAETPATDGERVYAWFGMTGLFCYDYNGKLLWSKDFGTYKTLNSWGTGSSPAFLNGMVFLQIDNEEKSFLVSLEGVTGKELWRVERDEKTTYSTPFIWKNRFRTELIAGGKVVRSYDPSTGNLLWQCKAGGGFSIPSPAASDELLILGNPGGPGKPGNLYAFKAGAKGDISFTDTTLTSNEWIAWSLSATGTGNPSPLLYKGLIYLVSSNGKNILCLDSGTGKTVYNAVNEKAGSCWSSPWAYNDKIYVTDERGNTYVIRAGEKYEVITQNGIKDKFWASPAISPDAYIFKGVKKVYCIGKK